MSAAKKDAIPPDRRVELVPDIKTGDGSLLAVYVWKRYRYMFDDGSSLDVRAIRDDSDLRVAVLGVVGPDRAIAGVATVPKGDSDVSSGPADD